MMSEAIIKTRQSGQSGMGDFKRGRVAMVCLLVLATYLVVAIFADNIALSDPMKTSSLTLQPPSLKFPFGTDDLGRDILSGVVHGARNSMMIGLTVAVLSCLIGAGIGMIAGYAGGWLDDVLMRFTELFLTPPRFFLALVIVAIFGSSFTNLIVLLSLTFWPITARLIRAETLAIKQRDFVLAARALGSSHARILRREIFPHLWPLLITNTVVRVGGVILLEAGLEFLGLGDQSRMTWGYLLHNGQHFMRDAWWMVVFPVLAISLLLIAINVAGDELNRLLSPKMSDIR
ncbi:MAG: ABC transporter permease [Blastocatellia bacterium]